MTRSTPAGIAIGLCFLAAMLEGFDIASMGVAAKTMMPDLGITDPEKIGQAFSASLLGLMFGAGLSGPSADRLGRRPVLIAAVAVYGLFSLLTAWTRGFELLLLVRFLTGLGLGGAMPMLIAMTSELSSHKRRTAAVGLITAGMPLGGALVGLLARSDFAVGNWQVIFLVGGIAPLVLAAVLWLLLPETKTKSAADVLTGDALAALFGRDRLATTAALWIAFAAVALVLHLFLNWLPSLLGDTPKAAAGIALLFNLGGAAGGVLVGLAIDRLGVRWPLAVVFASLVAVLLALASPGQGMTGLLAFGAGFLVMAGQFGLYGAAPHYYAVGVRGTGVAAAVSAGRLGSVLGPLAAGQLLGAGASPGQVVVATVPIVVLAGAAAMALSIWGKRAD
ncbi:MAG TPA: MFS transporter [Caulobacter sp.]|nr:MFS transporter [Caulobacter sp.]